MYTTGHNIQLKKWKIEIDILDIKIKCMEAHM